jgi:hypothetical protein
MVDADSHRRNASRNDFHRRVVVGGGAVPELTGPVMTPAKGSPRFALLPFAARPWHRSDITREPLQFASRGRSARRFGSRYANRT